MHRHRPRPGQPDLFSPPPELPTWPSLPPDIQQQLRQLLARMLRAKLLPPQTPHAKEVADE
jgi:hypothetical protein